MIFIFSIRVPLESFTISPRTTNKKINVYFKFNFDFQQNSTKG